MEATVAAFALEQPVFRQVRVSIEMRKVGRYPSRRIYNGVLVKWMACTLAEKSSSRFLGGWCLLELALYLLPRGGGIERP